MKTLLLRALLALFLFVSPVFADDNPVLIGYPDGKIMGFRGLDTRSRAPNLQDGRAVDLLNVMLSSSFDIRQRYGYSVINDTLDDLDIASPAITGIFDSEYGDGTSYTYAFIGNKLKYDNSGTWTAVTGTASITSSQDYQWSCIMALDYAVCTDDYDAPIKIASTPEKSSLSFTGLTHAVTKAKAHIWFRNYLVWGNTYENSIDYPTRFRWSNVGYIETYSDDDYDDLASLSGDEIVAFKEMYGELYIIMRKSIWKASLVGGDDTFVYAKLVDGIGAISRDSVQVVSFPENKQGIIFLSENKKVYLFNGVTVYDLGHIIQPTLNDLSASRLQYAVAIFDGENYYLSATTSSLSYNDTVFVYNVEINEWMIYDQINANAFARVKESTSTIKTYFGNYNGFIYWMDDTDLNNDVDGATGIIESAGLVNTDTETGAQIVVDNTLAEGKYTGAIIRITSGTGAGQERVILTQMATGLIVTTAFSTEPDSTSVYSVGDINSYYQTKWYDFGDAPRLKSFRGLYFWAEEASNNEVIISYKEDFSSTLGSETKSLSPNSSSLWDTAIWDESAWGSTGDKFYNAQLFGNGRNISIKFEQTGIDKTFHIYGFHLLADRLNRE